MKPKKLSLLLIFFLLQLTSCTGIEPTRMHNAVTLPRTLDVRDRVFSSEQLPAGVRGDFGLQHGISYTDYGSVQGGKIGYLNVQWQEDHWGIGVRPYFGVANVNVEGKSQLGASLWFAYHFGGGNLWKFSTQFIATSISGSVSEDSCASGKSTSLGLCEGKSSGGPKRSSTIKINEQEFLFSIRRKYSEQTNFLFVPGVQYIRINTSNVHDYYPGENYQYDIRYWGWALLGGVNISSVTFLVGANQVKSFLNGREKNIILPTFDFKVKL